MTSIRKINSKYHKDGIFEYYEIENVVSCTTCKDTWDDWIVTTCKNDIGEKSYYFIIDTEFNEAFAHWVFECMIHIPLFIKLKQDNKNIKLLLSCKRDFKMLMLDFLGIAEEDIVYNISNTNNICYISNATLLNSKNINEYHYKLIDNLFDIFRNINTTNDIKYKYIILPRQSKENFKGNEQYISYDNIIKMFNNYKESYYILNTDTITNIQDQINFIKNSDNIVVVDGSSFFVNGMFCKDKNIHICGRLCSEYQAEHFPGYGHLSRLIIKNGNRIIRYTNENEFIARNKHLFE